jgi:SAM-dependent methyltransferase
MVETWLVTDRERLGGTFDQAVELSQDARPEYPVALFERLVEAAELRRGDRVLEVGPGPGKATLDLVRRGLQVTAVEPGVALAAQARANLAGHPVDVVNRRFEDWNSRPGEFAAVVAATAWHWLDPYLRYGRAARALRPGGHLALWSAQHVFPVRGDPFFDELQEVYEQIGEAPPEEAPRPAPGELPEMTD